MNLDDDALLATADLVGRTGATGFEIGFLNDEPPHQWYAHAQYRGARITAEDHPGPVEAADALARRLLDGAMCTHCRGLIALSDEGAMFYPTAATTPTHGHQPLTEAEARSNPQCRYRREGRQWVRGCLDQSQPSRGPNRATRRARKVRGS